MRRRPNTSFRPTLEQFETKQLLSAGAGAASTAKHTARTQAADARRNPFDRPPPHQFYGFRITNPSNKIPGDFVPYPPFLQVLVQKRKPVPGQVYNVLQIAVKNVTAQTFTSANNFTVRLNQEKQSFPVLTGSQVWKPGGVVVFYIMTKKYYPLAQVYGGFQLDMGGRSSTLVPGPSGIFLRLKYNPATFAKTLDFIVAYGQGNQTGNGSPLGIANTSINGFVAAKTRRNDYGGHF